MNEKQNRIGEKKRWVFDDKQNRLNDKINMNEKYNWIGEKKRWGSDK